MLEIPPVGYGTFQVRDEVTTPLLVKAAVEKGYKLFDSASAYGNEELVTGAIRAEIDSGTVKRDQIFYTTKLSPRQIVGASIDGGVKVRAAIEASLAKLNGIEYIDLLLIHWPGSSGVQPNDPQNAEDRIKAWSIMEEFQKSGQIKHIGVSNFLPRHIESITNAGGSKPYLNQIELHPLCMGMQRETVEYCRSKGIIVQSYSSLGSGDQTLLGHPFFKELVAQFNKGKDESHSITLAQLILAYMVQRHHFHIIPRTTKIDRLEENLKVDKQDLKLDLDSLFDKIDDFIDPKKNPSFKESKFCWDPTKVA